MDTEKLLKIELAAELLEGASAGYKKYIARLQEKLDKGTDPSSWPTVHPDDWDARGRAIRKANLALSLLAYCDVLPEIEEQIVVKADDLFPEHNGKTIRAEMAYFESASYSCDRAAVWLHEKGYFRVTAVAGWGKP